MHRGRRSDDLLQTIQDHQEKAMEHVRMNPSFAHSGSARSPLQDSSDWLELARLLNGIDWVTMNLDGRFQLTDKPARGSCPVLIPIEEAVVRLEFAKQAAESLRLSLQVIACTQARAAGALTADIDPRDRKFLSGTKTADGLHVFCSSLDAAISRALVYALYADVVCFTSPNADFSEAVRFASELKASFPAIRLAFGLSPKPDGASWNELEHRALERKLGSVGYDYYFVTQFGRTIFPYSPVCGSWILFDDAAPGSSGREETLTDEMSPLTRRHVGGRMLLTRQFSGRYSSRIHQEMRARR